MQQQFGPRHPSRPSADRSEVADALVDALSLNAQVDPRRGAPA